MNKSHTSLAQHDTFLQGYDNAKLKFIVSVKTLQNWEQKRREPQGAARSLLRVADKAPGEILKALPRDMPSAHRHPVKSNKKSFSSK